MLRNGECEGWKCVAHGAGAGLAALYLLYNASAWIVRRERHLAVNAVLYSGLLVWELQNVAHHWRSRRGNSC